MFLNFNFQQVVNTLLFLGHVRRIGSVFGRIANGPDQPAEAGRRLRGVEPEHADDRRASPPDQISRDLRKVHRRSSRISPY